MVLLHALEKDTGAVPVGDIELAKQRMANFKRRRRPPRAVGKDGPRRAGRYEPLIKMDN